MNKNPMLDRPTIRFSTVPYDLNGYTGYRPQAEPMDGKYDLAFCQEVVNEKRLSMSAFELLHALNAVGEVGPQKVAEDGRPRGITKLIKYNRFMQGKLGSPTSVWNAETCKCVIRPQLLADSQKEIDGNFVNVTTGIKVRLNYVTYVGAKGVQNVIKVNTPFAAYGNHMEFDASLGDEATIAYENGTSLVEIPLTCTTSDVAHAEFAFPSELLVLEAGKALIFTMKSRGGVENGEEYTSRKSPITYLGGVVPAPQPPRITRLFSQEGDNKITIGESYTIEGENLENATVVFYDASDAPLETPAPEFTDGHLVGSAPQIDTPQSGRVKVTNPDGSTDQSVTYVLH